MAPLPYDQILIFGDSLVEWSSARESGFGLAPALQADSTEADRVVAYIRRLDVINRGFDGYNTRQALKILPQVIPAPEHANIRLLVVLLGANDATSPDAGNGFHVPVDQYIENLKKILTHPAVTAQNPKIMLITPPPIDEHKHAVKDKNAGYSGLTRFAHSAEAYAKACWQVGRELDIPVLDTWISFMRRAGIMDEAMPGSKDAPKNDVLDKLLSDGVHLSAEGYKVLFDELIGLIESQWPELMPESIPYVFPKYDEFTDDESDDGCSLAS